MIPSTSLIHLRYTSLVVLLLAVVSLQAQRRNGDDEVVNTKTAAHLFSLGLGTDLPMGDLADRFGRNNKVTGGYRYLTASDWVIGGDVSFYYGDNVREDVLAPLRTSSRGLILSSGESFTNAILRQRGMFVGAEIGKIFALERYYRSGIEATLGLGVMQHQIRIVDNSQNIVKIAGSRKRGYDRLSRGFAAKQTIAYHHLSSDRRINYSVGLEFAQGFTSGVRAVNWDTGLPPASGRIDLMIGLKVEWILPFWTGKSNEDVFY